MRGVLVLSCGLALLAPPGRALAQADSGAAIATGRTLRIDSRILAEARLIDVTLPAGYAAEPEHRYPVVVVLDGDVEHEVAAAIARFYAGTSMLPPLIVVGVRNTNRMRDLTPAPVAGFRVPPEAEGAGGADRFLEFLSRELLPWVDRTWRTAPMRVLVGHSLGGLFALYALSRQPDLFTGYLVMEPATWWNDGRELAAALNALRQPAARRARVITVNTPRFGLDTTQWGGVGPMVRHLSATGETHASVAAEGILQGLRTMFADFRPAGWLPGTRPVEILNRYDSLAGRVGYAVPIPEDAFAEAIRMSIHARFFDDAARALDRMERTLGASDESRGLHEELASERATPQPAGFIPLVIPARRPTPRDARAFLGRWETAGPADRHEVEFRASGDTILAHDRIQFPNGEWFESDDPVIQVTADGTLEWGLPFFRGIAALVVVSGRVQADGVMTATREPRGWVPHQMGPDMTRTERFRRMAPQP